MVDRVCKKVISKLIPEKYYKSLSSRIIGFAKVTTLKVLSGLITEYSELEDEDVQYINRKIKEPISGKTLSEEFVDQIEWNQEALAVQNPYSLAQIFSMAYLNIKKCGLYQDDCRGWPRKPRLEKTWRNFKAHFARAFKETRRSSKTSNTEGCAANVHAALANAELFTEMHQDHTLALANIATATQADRTSVALLTKTISELSSQVATLTAKLATAQSKNAWLKNRDIVQSQPSTSIGRPAI